MKLIALAVVVVQTFSFSTLVRVGLNEAPPRYGDNRVLYSFSTLVRVGLNEAFQLLDISGHVLVFQYPRSGRSQ